MLGVDADYNHENPLVNAQLRNKQETNVHNFMGNWNHILPQLNKLSEHFVSRHQMITLKISAEENSTITSVDRNSQCRPPTKLTNYHFCTDHKNGITGKSRKSIPG